MSNLIDGNTNQRIAELGSIQFCEGDCGNGDSTIAASGWVNNRLNYIVTNGLADANSQTLTLECRLRKLAASSVCNSG